MIVFKIQPNALSTFRLQSSQLSEQDFDLQLPALQNLLKKCFECETIQENEQSSCDIFTCKAIKFTFIADTYVFSYDGKQILMVSSNQVYVYDLNKARDNFATLSQEDCDYKLDLQNVFDSKNQILKKIEFIDEENILLYSANKIITRTKIRVYNIHDKKVLKYDYDKLCINGELLKILK